MATAAERRVEVARKRRPRRNKDHRAKDWEEFLADAGWTAKQAKEPEGTLRREDYWRPKWFWTLYNPPRRPDETRVCDACGLIVEDGQCAIHPASTWLDYREGTKPGDRNGARAWHVGCVTPEMWHEVLGQPLGAGPKPRRQTVTAKAVQELLDLGVVESDLDAKAIAKAWTQGLPESINGREPCPARGLASSWPGCRPA